MSCAVAEVDKRQRDTSGGTGTSRFCMHETPCVWASRASRRGTSAAPPQCLAAACRLMASVKTRSGEAAFASVSRDGDVDGEPRLELARGCVHPNELDGDALHDLDEVA